MTYGPEMRASDGDREKIAGRLREAHTEGRISGDEFYDRIDALYKAQTFGELEPLVRDIPALRTHKTPDIVAESSPATAPAPAASPGRRRGAFDKTMIVLWTIWACAVGVNLLIWAMVSVGNGDAHYFWPIWVAGPLGIVLFCLDMLRRALRS